MKTIQVDIKDIDHILLWGEYDQNLRYLSDSLALEIISRGDRIVLIGPDERVKEAEDVLEKLMSIARSGKNVELKDIENEVNRVRSVELGLPVGEEEFIINLARRVIRPKTEGQLEYLKAIRDYDIVFGIGPAGTGKTYLAVAMAILSYNYHLVDRIILVRPAVEAGESLGFLPGDLQEKVNPYLRPIYDALYEMLGIDKVRKMIQDGSIEIAPLAYMRGRTLNNAFCILDEGQNTTLDQLKMFLTRQGFRSKSVITGDITQIDLKDKSKSGLVIVQNILKNIYGIKFIYLTQSDVVRHRLVQSVINAFNEWEEKNNNNNKI